MPVVLTVPNGQAGEGLELITAQGPTQRVQMGDVQASSSPLVTINWDWSGNSPLTELLAAGHAPGIYLVCSTLVGLGPVDSGSYDVVAHWHQDGDDQNVSCGTGSGDRGPLTTVATLIFSDGTAPIQIQGTGNVLSDAGAILRASVLPIAVSS